MIRAIDIVISILVMLLLSPIFLIAAIAIFIESGYPVFFRQKRVGRNNEEFVMIKFRSMAHDNRFSFLGDSEQSPTNLEETAEVYQRTSVNDSRITKVGEVIRRFHIDELPQMVNVVFGEMSLVGPRPDVRAQEEEYYPRHWAERTSVKPGLTGLAQVMNDRATSVSRRTALDLLGIRRAGFLMYFWILIMTAVKTVKGSSF
ncbi:sugar transferase [Pseudomonadales bacterium]|jgi:lipopolysaccharide/colanic/teichoic acid biosynthesis glycosyltransferase|nr:sugar transferase [Pseudomonadales bacterium]